ncbi:MAG: PhoH family protein [Alphaproteobacteria bacterium]
MTENRPEAAAEPIVLQFGDNRLLPLLFGEFDQNLSRIEQNLGVKLSSRGNRISITGSESAGDVAREALNALYRRLKRGLTVDAAEVDAALRLAASGVAQRTGGIDGAGEEIVIRTPRQYITPRSAGQQAYMRALAEGNMVFGLGPAGTGKTYLAVAMGVSLLISGQVDRIILSRPAVEAGERLGFLPGDLKEKIDPYLGPLYDALYDMLPVDQVTNRLNSGEIEIAPLAFMRGRTLSHAYVILDEAQNATRMQMKMFLTRLGANARMAVTGDPSQVDLPRGEKSGLAHAVGLLENVEGVSLVRFSDVDVVRHSLVTRIVRAYEADERSVDGGDARDGDRK